MKVENPHMGSNLLWPAVLRVWGAPLYIDRAPTSFLLRGDHCRRFNGAVQATQLTDALR